VTGVQTCALPIFATVDDPKQNVFTLEKVGVI